MSNRIESLMWRHAHLATNFDKTPEEWEEYRGMRDEIEHALKFTKQITRVACSIKSITHAIERYKENPAYSMFTPTEFIGLAKFYCEYLPSIGLKMTDRTRSQFQKFIKENSNETLNQSIKENVTTTLLN